jgi:hypothetical protein
MFPFDGFLEMCGENSCEVYVFHGALVLIVAMLCKKAMLMLWHAFPILGI